MKKISLKNLDVFKGELLSREDLKKVMGGAESGSGENLCAVTTSDPICGGNCQRSGGAADKCKPKTSDTTQCTCGGV